MFIKRYANRISFVIPLFSFFHESKPCKRKNFNASSHILILVFMMILQSILESVEHLIESGFRPKRSFFMAFGHDEEASGYEGASAISDLLIKDRKVTDLLYLLDEGSIIMKSGSFPGVSNSAIAMYAFS